MISINVTGLDKVRDDLNKRVNPKKIEEALIKGGLLIEGEAKTVCRDLRAVDTGRLMGSISTNWGSNTGQGQVESPALPEDGVDKPELPAGAIAVVRVGTNVDYAEYVHDGTRRMPPRPFLTIAANNKQADVNKLVEETLK